MRVQQAIVCGFYGQDLLSFSPAKTEIRISYSKYIKHKEAVSDRVMVRRQITFLLHREAVKISSSTNEDFEVKNWLFPHMVLQCCHRIRQGKKERPDEDKAFDKTFQCL